MDKKIGYIFTQLKKKVILQFLQEQNSISNDASTWGMNEIKLFQDHLFERTNNTVSEKWFYTYFKNNPEKLPRVDMLNILSFFQYILNDKSIKFNILFLILNKSC